MNPVVDGMGKKYPGKIASAVVSAFSPEGQEAVKKHQLQKRHGVVAVDALDNVVYRYDGHEITPEELEEAVGKLVR